MHEIIHTLKTQSELKVSSGQRLIVNAIMRVCVHVAVCRSVCVSVTLTASGYLAVRRRVPVHLLCHRSDVFGVTVTLVVVEIIQRAATRAPALVAACVHVTLRVALRVAHTVTACVIERAVGVRVRERLAAFTPFPI